MRPVILIVDDSPEERTLISSILEESGRYSVETAASGEEALTRLERGGIDLLVTDFVMPGLDGLQLINRAVEIDPSLKSRMLIVTGGMYGRDDALAFATGTDVLTKPFSLDLFLKTIETLLGRPQEV